jgi:prolyl 4-hydroxylase
MDNYFQIIDNFLSPEQCRDLIQVSEKIGYVPADISFPKAQGGPRMIPNYRNNDRVLYSNEDFRKYIEFKLGDKIPKTHTIQLTNTETLTGDFVEVSGNFRFYRYGAGHFFKKHRDTSEKKLNGFSRITILLYLNTVELGDGGCTNLVDFILSNKISVQPVQGRLLMFDHCIMHEGEILNSGEKYLIRTDLIYSK